MLEHILDSFARLRTVAVKNRRRDWRKYAPRKSPAHLSRTVVTGVMGVTLSVAVWLVASHWENRVAELEFNARANNVASTLQTGLNEYLAKIVALRALFEASDKGVTRAEFQSFAERILKSQPAILSVSWIPRVTHAERAAHEQAAIRDGVVNYHIKRVNPDGTLTNSPEETEYFPVYYTTEKERADAIYGLDVGDGGMREDALARARDSNQLAASRSLTLQTGLGDRRGFFVVLPLYKQGSQYRTIEERRANLSGFVQGVFQIDIMVDTVLSGIKSPLDFFIYPSSADAGAKPLRFRTASAQGTHLATDVPKSRLRWSGDVKVADLRWTLVAVPSAGQAAFVDLSAWILLGAGLLVTAFGTVFVWSTGRYSQRLLQANRKASEQALTDVVTGLPNRRAFFERLSTCFSAPEPRSVAVLYIDLDHFKDVNDTLGHSVGDRLLRRTAERLQACVARTDMVARFGGDELAVLRAGPIDRTELAVLAAGIVKALGAGYSVDGNDIRISASVGIACSSHEMTGPESIMMQADLALYRAKEDGRNCFRFHDSLLDQKFRERVALGDELRLGIERGELRLHYQPQVEITSGRLVGLEALVRWHHPTRGLIPPSMFIPIAERTGAVNSLGSWVFEEACRQFTAWRAEGIAPETLAVNLSAIQFRQANLEIDFREIMRRHSVGPGVLEVELTESVLMETTLQQRDIIERLKSLGLKIAIDDFGTGYSSLNYLAAYPVDRLKIAQELVFGVTKDFKHDLVVKAAVRLAHELGIEVIAEGVETEAQARFLVAAECKYAQGFFFNPPLTADAITALLRQGRVNLFAGATAAGEAPAEGVARPAYPRLQSLNG